MNNLERKIRESGDYYCSSCHQQIDEYDYEYDEDEKYKHWNHSDITVSDEDGEYICTCNVCDEPDSFLISKEDVKIRQQAMYNLVCKVFKKIKDHEENRK